MLSFIYYNFVTNITNRLSFIKPIEKIISIFYNVKRKQKKKHKNFRRNKSSTKFFCVIFILKSFILNSFKDLILKKYFQK